MYYEQIISLNLVVWSEDVQGKGFLSMVDEFDGFICTANCQDGQ